GAGLASSQPDEAYVGARVTIVAAAEAGGGPQGPRGGRRAGRGPGPHAARARMVLRVRRPSDGELAQMARGAVLVGMLEPFNAEGIAAMNTAGLTAFALEAAPRTTRAQRMDVLSSPGTSGR